MSALVADQEGVGCSNILLEKNNNINFIYSVDRIMDFNKAEPTCYGTNFPYTSSG